MEVNLGFLPERIDIRSASGNRTFDTVFGIH